MSQNNDCLSVLCARVAAQDQELLKMSALNEKLRETLQQAKTHHEKTVQLVKALDAEVGSVPDTKAAPMFKELLEHLK